MKYDSVKSMMEKIIPEIMNTIVENINALNVPTSSKIDAFLSTAMSIVSSTIMTASNAVSDEDKGGGKDVFFDRLKEEFINQIKQIKLTKEVH
jgi:hypothetical protein